MNHEGKVGPPDLWAEALAWYTTLRAGDARQLSSKVASAWQDWYATAQNRQVFDSLNRLLSERELYRKRPRPSKAELNEDSYDLSLPIAEWLSSRPAHAAKPRSSLAAKWWSVSHGLTIAASIVLLLTVASALWFSRRGVRGSPTVYQTGIGGLRDIYLRDGSSVTLGGETRLLISFSSHTRSVNLVEGQAWFKVVHDVHRPFIVTAGDGTIEDVGTAFLVTRESDRVIVTVTEGVVEVSTRPYLAAFATLDQTLAAKPVLAAIRVGRGEELAFGDNGVLEPVKPADTQDATAWTHGRLTFDDQPLRYVIETVDRYSPRPITVTPEAGALRFSGIVFNNEVDDWLQSLEGILPVRIERRGAAVRVGLRSAPRVITNRDKHAPSSY